MRKIFLVVMMFFVLTGCSSNEPINTEAVLPTNTISLPTYTCTSTSTLEPTATPEPTETMTPTITFTPSPTAIAGGGKIAFWGIDEEIKYKLYLTDIDGFERKVIFDPDDYDLSSKQLVTYMGKYMEWSPDGNYLKFYIVDFKKGEYYLFLFDGLTEEISLIATQEIIINSYWSMDGKYIFYTLAGKLNIVDVANNLGTVQIEYPEFAGYPIGLFKDDLIYFLQTSLEPTNTVLYYFGKNQISYLNESGEPLSTEVEPFQGLFTIDFSGQVNQIATFDEDMRNALIGLYGQFYIHGQDIYFQSCNKNETGSKTCVLYSYNLDSNQLTEFISFENQQIWGLTFLPDGKNIWLSIGPLEGKTGKGYSEIINIQTKEVYYDFSNFGDNRFGNPSWSPDSNFAIFTNTIVVNYYAQSSTLGRLDMKTGEVATIVDDFKFVELPTWSP